MAQDTVNDLIGDVEEDGPAYLFEPAAKPGVHIGLLAGVMKDCPAQLDLNRFYRFEIQRRKGRVFLRQGQSQKYDTELMIAACVPLAG